MPTIDYFLSTISPFTYLAGGRLEQVAAKHGASVVYKPFDLVGNFPRTGGIHPAERHPARQAYRMQELHRVAKKTGMEINVKPAHWPTNPAPSAYAVIAAAGAGGGDVGALVQAFLRACWLGEQDIADEGVVRDCLAGAGFDPELANSGLMTGAQTYAANTEEAVNRGVFGAPSYLIDDQVFWGQDRIEYLDDYLAETAG